MTSSGRDRMLGRKHEPHCDCNIEHIVSGAGRSAITVMGSSEPEPKRSWLGGETNETRGKTMIKTAVANDDADWDDIIVRWYKAERTRIATSARNALSLMLTKPVLASKAALRFPR